ncbi:hypothetical protein DPMN_186196 [Dreissena polymorpha]|uniref:Uncharacterized protein n=1 Tax=Dreissena polymorpha TaxID=45954 RepID=A0A9D4I955_DREPO|nr:hypothetical protein DPMN_186196 [Dreissena polymorpha]
MEKDIRQLLTASPPDSSKSTTREVVFAELSLLTPFRGIHCPWMQKRQGADILGAVCSDTIVHPLY